MSRLDELQKIVGEVSDDFSKFYEKDNQAAGTRIRKAMQDLKELAQVIRKEVQEIKNKAEAVKAKADSGKAKAKPKPKAPAPKAKK